MNFPIVLPSIMLQYPLQMESFLVDSRPLQLFYSGIQFPCFVSGILNEMEDTNNGLFSPYKISSVVIVQVREV